MSLDIEPAYPVGATIPYGLKTEGANKSGDMALTHFAKNIPWSAPPCVNVRWTNAGWFIVYCEKQYVGSNDLC